MSEALTIALENGETVSGLLDMPANASALYVFAHGAGAGMKHKAMAATAAALAQHGIAVLRYQFPYMEKGGRRVDAPAVAHAAVRAAVAKAGELAPKLPLFAGGRSFGGRMTSQAQALKPLPGARGLIFFGFPLHPAGKPATERADHLAKVKIPTLFLSGTRDALAELELLRPVVDGLGKAATLHLVADADHSFHVPAKTGRKDADVLDEICDAARDWIQRAGSAL